MVLIECKLGPAEPIIGSTTYSFVRDRYDRFVASVHNQKHIKVLLAVEHYRIVPEIPEGVEPPKPPVPAVLAPVPATIDEQPGLGDTPPPPEQPAPAQEPAEEPTAVEPAVITDINGIGPSTASRLAEAGYTTVAQIAALTADDITALDQLLNLRGKIDREGWVAQAQALIKG